MFGIAFAIGSYSYLIFALGLLGILQKEIIFFLTSIFIGFYIFLNRENVKSLCCELHNVLNSLDTHNIYFLVIILICFQAVVNLIGALGPEIAFDALWYHLTLPKIYLIDRSIHYIPGGLLYYSAMPKLIEILYIPALALGNEIVAKLIHYFFGILTLIVTYKLSRKYLSPKYSLLTVLIFYSNLVVAWESTTAYIDLARAFFEIMALWLFINWWEKHDRVLLIKSGMMLGFAISAKLLSIGSLIILLIFIIYKTLLRTQKNHFSSINNLFIFLFFSLLIPLPWFIFSYINNGNPVYPFFTNTYNVRLNYQSLLNPVTFITDMWQLLVTNSDPISPIYIILLPLIVINFSKLKMSEKIIAYYSIACVLLWYFTPRTGGGRFILPYLPAFSILCALIIKQVSYERIRYFIIYIILFLSLITISYRTVANSRYLNVLLGSQTKENFLADNLNYEYGDFYDVDRYFEKNISAKDMILVYGIHNLYYVNFPFIHESWVKKGDKFNYVLIKDNILPKEMKQAKLVYSNEKIKIKLYKSEKKSWVY